MMQHSWLRTILPIASIFSFRLLGLFMLIPVFTLYTSSLEHATPTLMGIALGSYGLSQGILQIPFGLLSDFFGRKTMITLGLILFALGSLVGAYATSIETMILARVIQGAGAIGSVLIALLADLTPDNARTKAMAIVGITIGVSFGLAMVISPLIAHAYGLSGIFFLTTILALLALILLHTVIPTPQQDPFHNNNAALKQRFYDALKNRHLQRINISIFFQHLILTATFFVLPLLLKQQIKLHHLQASWHFYLSLMLVSFVIMMPAIGFAERKKKTKMLFILAVSLTTLGQSLLFFWHLSWTGLCIAMFFYFTAFNLLEATLPSLVSRQADPESKGAAMGIYSSCQFLGIFAGGSLAGMLYAYAGIPGVLSLNTLIGALWVGIAFFIKTNAYQFTHTIPFRNPRPDIHLLIQDLQQLPGVTSASFSETQQQIFLRISKGVYDEGSAERAVEKFLV